MSVSSDFWTSREPKGSSAKRLAQTFRRTSTTPAPLNAAQPGPSRRFTLGEIEPRRKSNLTVLPLRLSKTRSRTSDDGTVEISPATQSKALGDAVFALPNEIQVVVLSHLDARDILSLRLTNHAINEILLSSAASITRPILNSSIQGDTATYLDVLYPLPRPLNGLDHLLQMLHRQAVADKMVVAVTDFIQYKIYQVKSAARQRQFAPIRKRMMERLKTPAFIICHFLETLRAEILKPMSAEVACRQHPVWFPQQDIREICAGCKHLQCRIIAQYPEADLLPTYQFFKIMVSAFRQKLRPPSYAGSIERRLRGWNRDAASDADVVKVLLFGGLGEIHRIMKGPKFMARLADLQRFTSSVSSSPEAAAAAAFTISNKDDRTPAMKALDTPTPCVLPIPLPALTTIWLPAARSRILRTAIVNGTVQNEWSIPDAFTFIQDIVADREPSLGSSEPFDPNIDFEARTAADAEDDGDEDDAAAAAAQLHSLLEAQAQTQQPNMWHWRFYIHEWGLEPHLKYAEGVRIEAPVPLVSFRLA